MTQLLINNGLYDVAGSPCIGSGGEGTIYRIADAMAAKVYFPDKIDDQLRKKVLALCNCFANHVAELGGTAFAFPQHPAYDGQEGFHLVVGFSMAYFKDCPDLLAMAYDLNDRRYSSPELTDDSKAIALIYKIFELTQRLHRARVILGDISPDNILYDHHLEAPIFIDLGAVKYGAFECRPYKAEYLDPVVERTGTKLNGAYDYSTESDIFALACVAYELFVGVHPFFFYTSPPAVEEENKRQGISILRYWTQGDSHLRAAGRQCPPNEVNDAILERLKVLRTQDQGLFDFFVSVFVDNERESLLARLPVTDRRNPAHSIVFDRIIKPLGTLGFGDTIEELGREIEAASRQQATRPVFTLPVPATREPDKIEPLPDTGVYGDPEELGAFLSNYGIAYTALARGL